MAGGGGRRPVVRWELQGPLHGRWGVCGRRALGSGDPLPHLPLQTALLDLRPQRGPSLPSQNYHVSVLQGPQGPQGPLGPPGEMGPKVSAEDPLFVP